MTQLSDFKLPLPEAQNEIFSVSSNGKRAVVSYLVRDDSPESPRDYDNLGTMACFHRHYSLGDKDVPSLEEVKNIGKNTKEYISLPLYLYDHSDITMNTTGFSCPWDSGTVGIIYVSKEKVRKEYNWSKLTKERIGKILTYLKGEVEIYDQYLTGKVYGICHCTYLWDSEEEVWEEGEGDECWGFYGADAEETMKQEHEYWKETIEKPTPFKVDVNQLTLFEWKERI